MAHRIVVRSRAGMLLAELLISIAILALLLTAVGSAMVATAGTMKASDAFTRATHAGRLALDRLGRDVRLSDACQVGTAAQQNANRIEASTLDIVTAEGDALRYAFADRTLTLCINGQSPVVLVHDVDGGFVAATTSTNGVRTTTSVSYELNVHAGPQVLRLTGSTTPRRTL